MIAGSSRAGGASQTAGQYHGRTGRKSNRALWSLSTRDISKHIKELYQMDISASTLPSITDKAVPAMNEWRFRSLDSVYAFVYLGCMHYKVREEML